MKTTGSIHLLLFLTAMLAPTPLVAQAPPIAPGEKMAPKVERVPGGMTLTIDPTVSLRRYQLQQNETLGPTGWFDVGVEHVGDGNRLVRTVPINPGTSRFYRFTLDASNAPIGFARIPAGSFIMGDAKDANSWGDAPLVTVNVSEFFMAKQEVTKVLWDEVRTWGSTRGYTDIAAGGGKGANHPVHTVTWWDVVKWCNARSEKDGLTPVYRNSNNSVFKTGTTAPVANWNANGYRLPTEAEWEKAARGGLSGQRFPWGNEINHTHANYRANGNAYTYDTSPYTTLTYHPTYNDGVTPYTAPVGSFSANGYGLHDMTGNVWEWCWDWYSGSTYTGNASNPKGPASGTIRVTRGGNWADSFMFGCRSADRGGVTPGNTNGGHGRGFRPARNSVP